MNLRSLTTLLGLCLCAFMACKKSTTGNDTIKPPADTLKTVKGVDVYVSGSSTLAGGTVKVATYWKNGVMRKMNDSASATASSAREVVISGDDVYVSGIRGQTIVCWKNGAEIATFSGIAGGITVNNNDVYIYGALQSAGKTTPRYWKNGVAVDPPGVLSLTGMAVKGNDVYMAGSSQTVNGKLVATCWKNGVRTVLSKDSTVNSTAIFIRIYDNDIYVVGTANSKATYWKNGIQTEIDGTGNSIYHLTFSKGDVYVSGSKKAGTGTITTACYWKNNMMVDIINDPAATVSSRVSSTAVFGNDVYIAGSINNVIGYWKNTTWVPYLNTLDATYLGIKVIERY